MGIANPGCGPNHRIRTNFANTFQPKLPQHMKSPLVRCIKNDDYPASLVLGKIYAVLPDPDAEQHRWIRIVDETGLDYLYPEDCFQPVLPFQTGPMAG